MKRWIRPGPSSGLGGSYVPVVAGVVLAAVVSGRIAAQEKDKPDETPKLKLETQQNDEGETVFVLSGPLALPSGTVVSAHLGFGGSTIEQGKRGTVQSGELTIRFGPWRNKKVLAGTYTVRLELLKQFQPEGIQATFANLKIEIPLHSAKCGTDADAERDREFVKKKMTDVAESFRLSYLDLNQVGTFYLAELLALFIAEKSDPPPPPADLERIKRERQSRIAIVFPGWKTVTNANWNERFKTARFDWKLYREQVLATPFPEAESHLELLDRTIDAWMRGMQKSVYKMCGKLSELPKEFAEGPAIEAAQHEKAVIDAAQALFMALGYKAMPSFSISDLAQMEKGVRSEDGSWYRSFITKFSIKKPKEWVWMTPGAKPSMRVRYAPLDTDPKNPSNIVGAVEILDYATAKDHHDLQRLAQEQNRTRWRGGKELSSKSIRAFDPTMPNQERPGLDTEFTIEEKGQRLHGRYYQLFCRWHKRTYGVLCLAPEAKWKEVDPQFRLSINSFRVLDSPEYHDMKEDEIKRRLAEAGQQATNQRKLRQWELGEDVKDMPDKKPEETKKPEKPGDKPK